MAGSTSIVKEKKRRSDMGYFDGLFRNLSPIRFQEVNWSKQGYANVSSAQTSIYGAMTTRKLNGVHAKKVGDRLFVYSDNFIGVLPTEDITLDEAFRRANKCLEKNPDIEKWPIPERLVPHYEGLTNFQIGMKMRDILKEKYPYLTITAYDKSGFGVGRDKSYGSVCGASEVEEAKSTKVVSAVTEPPVVITEEVTKEDIPVVNKVTPSNDDVLVRIETGTGRYPMVTAMPEIPFEMASDLGEYLSSKGYEVNMKIFHGKDRKCYAILSYSKGA